MRVLDTAAEFLARVTGIEGAFTETQVVVQCDWQWNQRLIMCLACLHCGGLLQVAWQMAVRVVTSRFRVWTN